MLIHNQEKDWKASSLTDKATVLLKVRLAFESPLAQSFLSQVINPRYEHGLSTTSEYLNVSVGEK